MRISSDQRDSGWAKLQEWGGPHCGARIFLDGAETKHVVTADEEMGEVLVEATDAEGRPMLDGDTIRREWRRGKVEIVMPGRDEPREFKPTHGRVRIKFDAFSGERVAEAVRDVARAAIGPADIGRFLYAVAFPDLADTATLAEMDRRFARAREEEAVLAAAERMSRWHALLPAATLTRDD